MASALAKVKEGWMFKMIEIARQSARDKTTFLLCRAIVKPLHNPSLQLPRAATHRWRPNSMPLLEQIQGRWQIQISRKVPANMTHIWLMPISRKVRPKKGPRKVRAYNKGK
jgi:hypothetical protein